MNKSNASNSFEHLLIIIIFTTIVYLPSLHGDFVYDDAETIVKNPYIKNINYIPSYFDPRNANMWSFHVDQRMYYRPIPLVTFALNYSVSGLNAFSYHLVNLIVHIFTTMTIFFAIRLTMVSFQEPFLEKRQNSIPFIASLLFALHPMQTESVAYVVSRSVIICAFFLIGSLIAFILAFNKKDNNIQFLNILSWLLFVLSLCSKEIGIVFPLLIFTYAWVHAKQDSSLNGWKSGLYDSIPYFAILAFYLLIRTIFIGGSELISLLHNLERYFATAVKAVFIYLRLLIIPLGQNVDHDLPLVDSIFEPLSMLAVISLLIIGWLIYAYVLKRSLFLSFWILWYFFSLAPNLVLPTNEAISEHTVYFPSIGFSVTAAYFVVKLWSRYRKLLGNNQELIKIGVASVLLLQLSFLTLHRNLVWQNSITLWRDSVKKSPNKYRPHVNLGHAYQSIGKIDAAIKDYKKALFIHPKNHVALNLLGMVFADKGNLKKAESFFRQSIAVKKQNPDAYNNLGFILIKQKRFSASIPFLKTALKVNPDSSTTLSNIGIAMVNSGQNEEGCRYLKRAATINPDEKRGRLLFDKWCKM